MNKQQVIDKLELTWTEFQNSFKGLPDDQLVEPGVVESWSVKDIIAHVSWWEEESLNHLPEILQGIRPQRYSVLYGGIDSFNALMTKKWNDLPLAEVRRRADETHRKLVEFLWSVPEDQFASENRFRRRLRVDTYAHYPIHIRSIRDWLESRT